MSKYIEASGSLTIQSDCAVTGSGSNAKPLTLGPGGSCGGKLSFEEALDGSQVVATSGNPGDNFEDLSAAAGLSEIQLLYIKSTANIVLRFQAIAASLQATAGVFPNGFAGGEVSTITLDGTAIVVTFLAGDTTAALCAARINAAAALAGLATPIATVVNGQLKIDGIATAVGSSGVGQITVDTGAASVTLGLAAAASPTNVDAQGKDVGVYSTLLAEFPRTGSDILTKVQVSGQATLDVVAAGRA